MCSLSCGSSETIRRDAVLLIGIVVKASRVCLVYPAQTASCPKASLLPGFLRTDLHVLKKFCMVLILWPCVLWF